VPRRKSPALTDAELRLMAVLWDRGRATVGDVVERLTSPRKPAYNTVLTLLRILERKGYVRHEKAGRAFVFLPIVDRSQARRSAVRHLLARFFEDSPSLLLLNLIQQGEVDANDLERVRDLIAKSE
jgi:predicted transcriptional regulator